ncbi:hypothetical protein LUZ61_005102 [Rhynchospora tenuis]|uniref:cytokinin dehydrogenase n=1 Tax=Rhynchospora tenuis TaxID=198213 RepID=A0AAD6EU67_9POAL|nr:hypothetical protein LUZ61_005102 [Rhynchospora tenuis]
MAYLPMPRLSTMSFISLIITTLLTSTLSLPEELFSLEIGTKIRSDKQSLMSVASDFGNLTKSIPAAVFYPSSSQDIADLIHFSYTHSTPFFISPRGHGHSINGQASIPDGVVIHMESLAQGRADQINVSVANRYMDVGGEQLWIDVLNAAHKHGLGANSWTDYLHLTVGGTLSVGGISGQTFQHGPQISNVLELDVITGTGQQVTCSKSHNQDLFNAVLGGLGQFGIITRARVPLSPTPEKVKWIRLIYTNIVAFTRDQERLISVDENERLFGFMKYLEGSLLMEQGLIGSWRSSSFFPKNDMERMAQLTAKHRLTALYYLEVVVAYDEDIAAEVDQELELLLDDLSFVPGFVFTREVTYVEFLDRVHDGELKLRKTGQWQVPHPWLNLFVPKSRILDFDAGVLKGILGSDKAEGPILIYPMNKKKWNSEMSAIIPDEEVFYTIGILRSATNDNLEKMLEQNKMILEFCTMEGIPFKQYMPHYTTKEGWMEHFGPKWDKLLELKMRYDPKGILSPAQKIYTFLLEDDYII